MPSSPEMSVFRLRLNQELLDCACCARIIQPDKYNYKAHACPLCSRGQFYCGICMSDHSCLQVPLVHVSYSLLNDIIAHMKFKCNCKKYFPYCEFQDHRQKCQSAKYFTNRGPACVWKCTLETSFLECSKCKGLIQPPVFLLQFRDRLICSACYRPDVGTYRHCTEVEDLLQGIMVKCVACKQYLPFSTLGPHQLCDCPESKLQNITVGLSARIKFCGEEKTKRPAVGSNSIHGKYGLEAPSEVGKTDNGAEVGNDDSSCDDSHGTSDDVLSYEDDSIDTMDEGEEVEKPETVKRVAKNAFKAPCDRKAKISTLYGQKTAQAPPKQPLQLFVPHRPVTRSRKRVLLTDGSTIDK